MFLNPIIPVWIILFFSIIMCIVAISIIVRKNNKLIDKIIQSIRIVLIIVLLFVINLRPMLTSKNGEFIMNNLNVLFVLDNTISMKAEDYSGGNTRLSAVKKDVSYIMEELSGASFGLIKFDNASNIVCPFTADTESVEDAISILNSVDTSLGKGSSLNLPKDHMKELLESANKKAEKRTICFFISDGEITDNSKLESYKSLAKYLSGGAVMGYGTEKGGKMKENPEYDYYVYDYENHGDAISKIDEKTLKEIANDLEIDYVRMDKQSDIDKILGPVKKLIVKESKASKKNSGKDLYYYFVLPLLVLIMWEWIDFKRRTN